LTSGFKIEEEIWSAQIMANIKYKMVDFMALRLCWKSFHKRSAYNGIQTYLSDKKIMNESSESLCHPFIYFNKALSQAGNIG
jgi:hypothetical protein